MHTILTSTSVNCDVLLRPTRTQYVFLGNHTNDDTMLDVDYDGDTRYSCTFAEFAAWLKAGKPIASITSPDDERLLQIDQLCASFDMESASAEDIRQHYQRVFALLKGVA